MSSYPTASHFTSFYNFTPSSGDRCIYYKRDKDTTCRSFCLPKDKARACEIYNEIIKSPRPPDIGLLEEYVRCNISCKPFGGFEGHREFVQNRLPSLVRELAARWLQEITKAKSSSVIKKEPEVESTVASTLTQSSHINSYATGHKNPESSTGIDPDVSWFVPFYKLNPYKRTTCIYMTQEGKNCPFPCNEEDIESARELFNEFNSTQEPPNIYHIMEYAMYNCCRAGEDGAGHQNRLEAVKLLVPLAERWCGEIISQREQDAAASTAQHDVGVSRRSSQKSTQGSSATVRGQDRTPSPDSDPISPTPAGPRYSLRSRPNGQPRRLHYDANYSPDNLSEFEPHVQNAKASVATILEKSIATDDPQRGHVYIYSRDESPGFVKIGYTTGLVQNRLDDWAKCDYVPRLLYSTEQNGAKIPFPKRVETLVHFELFKEWRAERLCKVCSKRHQEWFEISRERAIQVVTGWADVMTNIKPYDEHGHTKAWVREYVKAMLKSETPVTAKALLQHHKSLLAANKTTIKSPSVSSRSGVYTLPLSPSPEPPSRALTSRRNDYFDGSGGRGTLQPTGSQVTPPVTPERQAVLAPVYQTELVDTDTRKPRGFWKKLVGSSKKGQQNVLSKSGRMNDAYAGSVVTTWPPSPPMSPERSRVNSPRGEW